MATETQHTVAKNQRWRPRRDSALTCPQCGVTTQVHMPTDACQFFWACPACGAMLKPRAGDCCVFCSYGDVPCPPVQANRTGHR